MNESDKFFIEDFSLQCKIKLTEANIIYKTYKELIKPIKNYLNCKYLLLALEE